MTKSEPLSRLPPVGYNTAMSAFHSRTSAAVILLGLLTAVPAHAQAIPFTLPFFAMPNYELGTTSPFEGSYARVSTGFQVTSMKGFGSYSGPTFGVEAGKMWRNGQFVYGFVGAIDYMPAINGYPTANFGSAFYSRDFAGAAQFKAGILATPNVLLYTKLGVSALNETFHYGPTNFTAPFDKKAFNVRPDARVGAEWAVTDKLTIGVEAGVVGPAMR